MVPGDMGHDHEPDRGGVGRLGEMPSFHFHPLNDRGWVLHPASHDIDPGFDGWEYSHGPQPARKVSGIFHASPDHLPVPLPPEMAHHRIGGCHSGTVPGPGEGHISLGGEVGGLNPDGLLDPPVPQEQGTRRDGGKPHLVRIDSHGGHSRGSKIKDLRKILQKGKDKTPECGVHMERYPPFQCDLPHLRDGIHLAQLRGPGDPNHDRCVPGKSLLHCLDIHPEILGQRDPHRSHPQDIGSLEQ